jgi:hypothetical protein
MQACNVHRLAALGIEAAGVLLRLGGRSRSTEQGQIGPQSVATPMTNGVPLKITNSMRGFIGRADPQH